MELLYKLWDFENANLVNAYPSEATALAIVADYVEDNGRESVASWSLLRAVPDAAHEVIAEGDDLAALAGRVHFERTPRAVAD